MKVVTMCHHYIKLIHKFYVCCLHSWFYTLLKEVQHVFSIEIHIVREQVHLNECCSAKVFVFLQTQNKSIRSKNALDQ